ncbi:MAG: hypothetical protein E7004_07115 [Alphaproteobacteria bacterium]|nr:hypothetical protein [Alphaproteobacteria bacterium]
MSEKLDKQGQLALFEGPDAPDKVLNYVAHTPNPLCDEAEKLMFNLPNKEDVIEAYIRWHDLRVDAQVKMLELSCGLKLLKKYLERHYLCLEAQKSIFKLPNARDILEAFIETANLYQEAEDLIFSLPCANEILMKLFRCKSYLSDENEVKMINMPNNWKVFKSYINKFSLSELAEKELLSKKDSKRYLILYFEEGSTAYLSKEAEFMMLEHPDAKELVKVYLKHYNLYPEVRKKWDEMQAAAK